MTRKTKTWAEKMLTGTPHVETLDKAYAGAPASGKMLVSSPREVDAFINTRIAQGKTLTVAQLRDALAADHGADTTCPMSTGIFLRILAENAWDRLESGVAIDKITPFWRVVDPKSPLAKKLRAGPDWIEAQRTAEAKRGR